MGSRLRPLTVNIPKPLMPFGDLTIVEIIIKQLENCGFRKITLSLGYLSEMVIEKIIKKGNFKIHISYVLEESPLGTAGSLALLENEEEDILVMNGDVLTDIDFKQIVLDHQKEMSDVSLITKQIENRLEYGVIQIDEHGYLMSYSEKPKQTLSISTGIYVISQNTLALVPPIKIDFPDFLIALMDKNFRIRCHEHDGYWKDIGNVADYESARHDFQKNKTRFL